MKQYVADTHALYWYLMGSAQLSSSAKTAFDEAAAGQALIHIAAIVFAELYWLNEKLGRPLNMGHELARIKAAGNYAFLAFNAEDVPDFEHDTAVPEMHDRIIVGAARRLGAVLITRDRAIVAIGLVPTLW